MKWKKAADFGKRALAMFTALAMVFSGISVTGKQAKAAAEGDTKAEVTRTTYKDDKGVDRELITIKSAQDPKVYAELRDVLTIDKGSLADGTPYEELKQYDVKIYNGLSDTISDWELKIDRKRTYTSYQVGWNGVSMENNRTQINVGTYNAVDGWANNEINSKDNMGGAGFQVASRELADAEFTLTFRTGKSTGKFKEDAKAGHPSSITGEGIGNSNTGKVTAEVLRYPTPNDPKNYHQYYLKITNNTTETIKDWIVAFKTNDITGVDDWLWLFDDDLYCEHEGLPKGSETAPWKDLRLHAFYTGSYLYVGTQEGSAAGDIGPGESFGVGRGDSTSQLLEENWSDTFVAGDGKNHALACFVDGMGYEVKKDASGVPIKDENGEYIPATDDTGALMPIQVTKDNMKLDDAKFSYYGNIDLLSSSVADEDVGPGQTKAVVYYSTKGANAFDRILENAQYGATKPNDVSTQPITYEGSTPIIARERTVYIGQGGEKALEAYLTPANATVRNIIWTSDDSSKVTVYGKESIETDENTARIQVTENAKKGDRVTVTAALPNAKDLPGAAGSVKFNIEVIGLMGSGTTEDPYLIENKDDLKTFRNLVNGDEKREPYDFEGEVIGVTEEIDMGGETWTPIGTKEHPFQGTLKGNIYSRRNRHFIEGIKINNNQDYQGFFGCIGEKGLIENLNIVGEITARDYVGGIAGENNGTIVACASDVRVVGRNYVGGVAGYNTKQINGPRYGYGGYLDGDEAFDTESSGAVVSGEDYLGAIVGYNGEVGVVTSAYVAGRVNRPEAIRGIVTPCEDGSGEYYHSGENLPKVGVIAGYTANSAVSTAFVNSFYRQNDEYNAGLHAIGNICPEPAAIESRPGPSLFEGEGTEELPYKIESAEDLIKLCKSVNTGLSYKGYTFILVNDIDLEKNDWTPIGDLSTPLTSAKDSPFFDGVFEGNGHKITNLYINAKDKDYQGLFGYNRGTIQNLDVYGTVNAKDYVGGIAGRNQGFIINCHSYVTVTGNKNVGGISGSNEGTFDDDGEQTGGLIKDSTNDGKVTGKENTGGITGNNKNDGKVVNCTNNGEVNGGTNTGGIAGDNDGDIENGKNTGKVTGEKNTGGIAGTNEKDGNIDKSTNTGEITGNENTGGIAGKNDGDIKDCTNEGNVNGKKDGDGNGGTNTGGITGDNNGNIEGSDNKGKVTGDGDNTGGITGTNEKDGNIDKSHNGGDVEGGGDNTGGIAGKNDGNIKDSDNDGKVTGKGDNTGGIAGNNGEDGNIDKSDNRGDVEGGGDNTGGIAGKNDGNIKDSNNEGNVTGKGDNTGGVAGKNDGNITNSSNNGDVNGKDGTTGGLVGTNNGSVNGGNSGGLVNGKEPGPGNAVGSGSGTIINITYIIKNEGGGNGNGGTVNPPGTGGTVTPFTPALSTTKVLLQKGKSYKLTTNNKNVKITKVVCANKKSKKLVTVKKSGKIKAKKKLGTAKIKVTYTYAKKSYTKTVKVKVQKNAVCVLNKNKTVKVKKNAKFNIVNPANMLSSKGMKFKSAKKTIAKVTNKGVVTAKKKGSTKITVTMGKTKYTVNVKVK